MLQAALQANRLLIDAIAASTVRAREEDMQALVSTATRALRTLENLDSPLSLLECASQVVEAMALHSAQTADYLSGQSEQMQSIIGMLTDTLADVSGQHTDNITRLQAIEQQIEQVSELDDMKALTASLGDCLEAVRDAAARQRRASASTMDRLQSGLDSAQDRMAAKRAAASRSHSEIDLMPESSEPDTAITSFVAAFKLHRAEHIAARFGEGTKQRMLSLLSAPLKATMGPVDRLLRWKGASFVLFRSSPMSLAQIRAELAEVVSRTGEHYVDVGTRSALLPVVIDWTVFPQSKRASLEAVFSEVDDFLASD
jgi:hypothetical protein